MGNSLFLETYREGRKVTGDALQQIVLLMGIKGFFFLQNRHFGNKSAVYRAAIVYGNDEEP
jgi:hypothetical protein